MASRRRTWLLLCACLASAAHGAPDDAATASAALHPDGESYQLRRWTQADGAPQLAHNVTQTDDGLLWFAAPSGLHSFDGLHFRKEDKVYGHALPSSNIAFARKLMGGGLAVGYYFGGLSIFKPGAVTHYVAGKDFPRGTVRDIAVGKDGVIHAATGSGVFVLRDGKWRQEGQASLPKGPASWVSIDQSGRLWMYTGKDYYVRPNGSEDFVQVRVPPNSRVTLRTDGLYAKPEGGDYVRLDIVASAAADRYDQPGLYKSVPAHGPHGSQWAPRADGLVRLARGDDGVLRAAEVFPNGTGREELIPRTTVDREGNLWVTTPTGVERLRRHRFHRLSGLPDKFYWMAQRGFDDELWFGASGAPVTRIKADGSRHATSLRGMTALVRLAPDHVWVGGEGLWELRGDSEQRWALPPQTGKSGEVQAMAVDAKGRLLVSIARSGLWTFEHGEWRQDQRLAGLTDPVPISMLTDSRGRTWLGLTGGRLAELTASEARLLPASASLQVGNVLCLLDVGGKLLAGGDLGAAWIEGGSAHAIQPARADGFRHISGMVIDRQGSLWMHSNDGLHRFDAAALARFWQTPSQPLEAELFNFEDGIGGVAAAGRPLPSLALANNGRLYYATTSEIGWIAPDRIERNIRPPTVLLQSLRTREREYLPADPMQLPQDTTAIELAFSATALSIPERVRMKFRLSGVDQDWREAGLERRVQYTNLTPGHYRFEVIAANEDGAWNNEGAHLSFDIPPAFWQTDWFRLAGALVALLAAMLLYRWRVGVIERRVQLQAALQAEATLQERSRIARSLHDNLLQAVHALLLRFHAVEQKLAQHPELQKTVASAIDYAESLVASTRDEVQDLRRAQDANEMFAGLRHAAALASPGAEQRLSFTMLGQPRLLRIDACAELASVLREAVRNSVAHSQAQRIEVSLSFQDDVLLAEVSDDGVGLDASIAQHGKEGHWGITGMRERAARLGAQLDIASGPRGGVAVQLAIPAPQAYA